MDLAELLRRPEWKTLEFKRDLSSPDGVLKTLVAFANTAGGVLVIGVENRTKRIRGVADALAAEEKLANLIADLIRPRLVPDVETVPWRKANLLVVQVHPSNLRPHYFDRLGPERGVLVRVGSTNRQADAGLIEEMKRFVRMQAFDEQPLPELSSEAIDFRAASEYFAPRKITLSSLESLGVLTRHQGRKVPTIGGVLLFGKDRLERFPDAWVKAGRFAGSDRSRLIDSAEIRSYFPRAAEEALAFAQKHLRRETVIGPVRRTDRWTAPPVALREAVVNALVHADYAQGGAPIRLAIYDDRIEVENPGLLPLGLTVEDIRRGVSKLRNRVIGRVFFELRLIEQWGSGIQRMTAACEQAGLAAPALEELGTHFRVVISTVRQAPPRAGDRDQQILAMLAGGAGLTTAQIARRLKISSRATRARLQAMVERGLVVEFGSGPNDPRRRYLAAARGA